MDRQQLRRVVFAEGHDRRVLRTTEQLLDWNVCIPILIGDEAALSQIAKREGVGFSVGDDVEVVSSSDCHTFRDEWLREVLLPQLDVKSRPILRSNTQNTPVAARLVNDGFADCMICGTTGRPAWHFSQLVHVLDWGRWNAFGTLDGVICGDRYLFMGFPVNAQGRQIDKTAEIAIAAATFVGRLGLEPRIWICADDDRLIDGVIGQTAGFFEEGSSNLGNIGRVQSWQVVDRALGGATGACECDVVVFVSRKRAEEAKIQLRRAGASVISAAATTTFDNRAHVVSPTVTAQELVVISTGVAVGPALSRSTSPLFNFCSKKCNR